MKRSSARFTLPQAAKKLLQPIWRLKYVIAQGYFIPLRHEVVGRQYVFDGDSISRLKIALSKIRRNRPRAAKKLGTIF